MGGPGKEVKERWWDDFREQLKTVSGEQGTRVKYGKPEHMSYK